MLSSGDSLKTIGKISVDSQSRANVARLEGKYNFTLTRPGLINCNRFYDDGRPKIDYYAGLGDTTANYQTMIVFENINLLMQGQAQGNRVLLPNVPEGAPVKIICVGTREERLSLQCNLIEGRS